MGAVAAWGIVFSVVAAGAGIAVAAGAYRRHRRILRRGARLDAEIVAVEADRGKVRLSLRFAGIEEHVLEFRGYRLRPADTDALAVGDTVHTWVLPGDLSEIRVACGDAPDRVMAFQAGPEHRGEWPLTPGPMGGPIDNVFWPGH